MHLLPTILILRYDPLQLSNVYWSTWYDTLHSNDFNYSPVIHFYSTMLITLDDVLISYSFTLFTLIYYFPPMFVYVSDKLNLILICYLSMIIFYIYDTLASRNVINGRWYANYPCYLLIIMTHSSISMLILFSDTLHRKTVYCWLWLTRRWWF